MDDMNAFERLVAAEVQVEAGPSRPTDIAAVIRAAAAKSPRWRFPTMFSATRFIVAGAIVAVFGGVLLTGVLSTRQQTDPASGAIATPLESPEGTIREDVLPDYLRVEEVEPGVFRVDNDGFRSFGRDVGHGDLSTNPGFGSVVQRLLADRVVAGLDGSLWYLSEDELFRLGDPEEHDGAGSKVSVVSSRTLGSGPMAESGRPAGRALTSTGTTCCGSTTAMSGPS